MAMSYTTSSAKLQLVFTFSLFLALFIPSSLALNPDGTLLLSFKYAVASDPSSVLDNWSYEDETPCSWTGVSCASIGNPGKDRVISLILPNTQLVGSIPEELGLIDHLRNLNLSNNSLNGTLPNSLFNSSVLQILSLSSNLISGELPSLITGSALKFLNLSHNTITGTIPQSLTSLKSLSAVSLKNNQFSGTIPNGFDFTSFLDLSSNSLTGPLPLQFGGRRLNYLNLSYNKLSGPIPPEFAQNIPPKATIDLSFNALTGQIPLHSPLSNQKTDSFAGNADLCGEPLEKICTVPSTHSTPPNVTIITNTTTPSPTAAIAALPRTINSSQTPNAPGHQTHGGLNIKPFKLVAIVVGDLAGIGILAIIILYVYRWRKRLRHHDPEITNSKPSPAHKYEPTTIPKETKSSKRTWLCLSIASEETSDATTGYESEETGTAGTNTGNYNLQEKGKAENVKKLVMVDGETELQYEALFKASAYILGSSGPGGSGIVYKAVLEGGMTAYAVRRIGECAVESVREFESQVRAIAKLRHPNLVRVRGFYWGEDEKLLICDYVDNGNLATAPGYSKRVGSSPYSLPFEVRVKIAKGVARGLTYIHGKKHVHGNIKPSNILLTDDLDAIISDFGLHWLVSGKDSYKTEGSTRHFGSKRSISSRDHDQIPDFPISSSSYATNSANGFIGCTSPYHAPESLKNLKPNPKWDVYSFGIILLELITGKVFSDRELAHWTNGSVGDEKTRVLRMADVAIRADVKGREDAILACFRLGLSCASLVPQKRPSMKDAVQVLSKIPCSSRY